MRVISTGMTAREARLSRRSMPSSQSAWRIWRLHKHARSARGDDATVPRCRRNIIPVGGMDGPGPKAAGADGGTQGAVDPNAGKGRARLPAGAADIRGRIGSVVQLGYVPVGYRTRLF